MYQQEYSLGKFATAMQQLRELRRYFAVQGRRHKKKVRRIDRYEALYAFYCRKDDDDKLSVRDNRQIDRAQRKVRALVLTLQRESPPALYGQ